MRFHGPARIIAVQFAIWSADYTQTTGQALVTARVVRQQGEAQWRKYVYRGAGWRSVVSWIGAVLRLWRDVAFGRVKTLYLVCSRSDGGFLRDIPALLAARAGVRTIVHAHGSDIVDLLVNRRLSPFSRVLYARCEVVVPSKHLVEPLRAATTARIHLCENYFAGDFGEQTIDLPAHETLTVLWNSNVMASKGFFDLAEAIRQVWREGLAVRLVSVGQPLGDQEAPESEARRRLNVLLEHDWFEYRGKVTQSDAIAQLAEADAIALPSRYSSECQPLAIIQAMCSGKAVIASDIPALQATLCGYPARFVPVRSVDAIVGALCELHRQKRADPVAFASFREGVAAEARARFSADRFDREMAIILAGGKSSSDEIAVCPSTPHGPVGDATPVHPVEEGKSRAAALVRNADDHARAGDSG